MISFDDVFKRVESLTPDECAKMLYDSLVEAGAVLVKKESPGIYVDNFDIINYRSKAIEDRGE